VNEARSHKVIVVLVVASSLCVTLLITMLVFARNKPGTPIQGAQNSSLRVDLPPGGVAPITPVADPEATTAPTAKPTQAPPVLYPAPAFSFTERDGSTVTHKDLVGKIVVADFIFTRCGTICPRMSQQMAAIQGKLSGKPIWDQVRLVSFSVDPDFDTADILTDYAKRFEADKTHWLFLTGKRKEMWDIVKAGFKLPVAENTDDGLMPILHSEKFVLIDADGKIRGYYDGLQEEPFRRLLADVELLAGMKR
jgi:protein SCO1/2